MRRPCSASSVGNSTGTNSLACTAVFHRRVLAAMERKKNKLLYSLPWGIDCAEGFRRNRIASAIGFAVGAGAICAWAGPADGQSPSPPEPTVDFREKITV